MQNINQQNYKVVNGTTYNHSTHAKVIEVLERARMSNLRIRVFYGNALTGEDWMEENDTIGRIGRSTGKYQIPLLIKSASSSGGGALMDSSIVKITIDKRTVYQHPNYHQKILKVEPTDIHYQGVHYQGAVLSFYEGQKPEVTARFKKLESAHRWKNFMEGKRNTK